MKRYKAKHEKLAKEKENIVRAIKDGDPGSMRKEAIEHVRTLIEKIILTPKANQKNLSIDLYGDLVGILEFATEDKTMKGGHDTRLFNPLIANANYEKSVQLVAGAGFEPTAFGL